MYKYAIGLDIGITSVGWAALALNAEERPYGILSMGSRIFDAAEQPKTGESLAAPRRIARGSRRRLRRHRHRNERIKQLIVNEKILTEEQLDNLFDGRLEDIYALRVRALDEPVSAEEFARLLIHLAQRRGFKSNRRNPSTKEEGQLLTAVSENQRVMDANGYRSVAEMMLHDERFAEHKRNKGENYIGTVTRAMIESEAHMIFAAQRAFGAEFASENVETAYCEILLSQRSFDEGPGSGPYSGSQIDKMRGRCEFENDQPRAAKASYSFEYFNLLQNINNIKIESAGTTRALTDDERKKINELAHKKALLSYADIRKALQIPDTDRFNRVSYKSDKTAEESEKAEKFNYLKAWHTLRKEFEATEKGRFAKLSRKEINTIATALTLYKTSAGIRNYLAENGIADSDIDIAEKIGSFAKFGHLCEKVCDALIPYLEQGMKYNEACATAGYDFKAHGGEQRSKLLHLKPEDVEDITSPVVRRAVSQTIKVVNALIRKYGSPVYINIELAREMSKNFTERNKIKKSNDENRGNNERIMERIRTELGKTNPTGQDLIKLKLYNEQNGVCAYSLKSIALERLFEPGYTEIDHIIPYSLSFDDSFNNKVLVLSKENQEKKNRIPLEYLSGEQREKFIVYTNLNVRNYKKKQKLLKERLTEEDLSGFRERNLQDTKYISSFMLNYLNDRLEFAPSEKDRKKRVTAVNGAITSYLRKRWGIMKIREDGDVHHAVDAVVIACTTDGMIQQLSRYSELHECRYVQGDGESYAVDDKTGEVLRTLPYPWRDFRKELEARTGNNPQRLINDMKLPFYLDSELMSEVRPIFVSRMPRRKVKGAAHKDTIKSAKAIDEGIVVVKRPLKDLRLKDGEIENYFMPEADPRLYNALRERLAAFDGSGEKAFAEPFRKPTKSGEPGPLVKKVQLYEKSTLNVPVHGKTAVADNESMVRIDVFHIEGQGYYFVPIYVADTLKAELPDKACTRGKPYNEWLTMKEEDFLFSLYPNDLIKVTHKGKLKLSRLFKESTLPPSYETQEELLYYKSAGIAVAALTCINHDNSYTISSLGIKTLEKLEKYSVDILGEYHPVKKEVRQRFEMKRS